MNNTRCSWEMILNPTQFKSFLLDFWPSASFAAWHQMWVRQRSDSTWWLPHYPRQSPIGTMWTIHLENVCSHGIIPLTEICSKHLKSSVMSSPTWSGSISFEGDSISRSRLTFPLSTNWINHNNRMINAYLITESCLCSNRSKYYVHADRPIVRAISYAQGCEFQSNCMHGAHCISKGL